MKNGYQTVLENEKDVWVDSVYLKFIGKCEANNNLVDDSYVLDSIKPLNVERYDESADAKYRLEGNSANGWIPVTIDYENLTVSGTYNKAWIGGEVETFNFTYKIDPNSFYVKKDEITDMLRVSFSADSGE